MILSNKGVCMRVQKILPTTQQCKINYIEPQHNHFIHQPYDTVSFKGLSTSLVLLVIKKGYDGLKTNTERANFKNEVAQKMAEPDLSNNAKQLVDVLFALAKTKGKDEPSNIVYGLKDKYDFSKTLKELRSDAVGKLFPLIPVMKNDANCGNAAKYAMLESMIDSGEYLECPYMRDAFQSLFNGSNKESLILKAMRDKNVWREINSTYVIPKAKSLAESSYQYPEDKSDSDSFFHFLKVMFYDLPRDLMAQKQYAKKEIKNILPDIQKEYEIKKAIVNTSLFRTLDIRKHQDFFSAYNDLLKAQTTLAFNDIAKRLKENLYGQPENNMLYKKYAEGLKDLSLPEEDLAITYLSAITQRCKDDKALVAKEFNINPIYSEDIYKDFELLSKSLSISDKKTLKNIYGARINEKLQSKNKDIINSAGTLIYLSGRANELKSLLDSDERLVNARLNLKSKMDNNSAIYGAKEPQIPTLKELEAEAERRYEEYKRIESNLSEADLDMMETHARLNYL